MNNNIQPSVGFANLSLDSQFEAGLRLHRAGNLREAANVYRELLNRSPRHVGALRNLGLLQSSDGNYAEATRLLRRAIRCGPATASVYRDLARALTAAGDLRTAVATYGKALQLIPDDPFGHCELGAVLHSLGRRSEAMSHYRKAIALKPDFAAAYNDLGVALQEMNNLEEALRSFSQAVALDPTSAACHNNLGTILREAGHLSASADAYETAVALAPRNGNYLRNLAVSRTFTRHDPQLARMEDVARETALPDMDRMELHFALGKIYDDIGEYDKAFKHFVDGNHLKRQALSYDEAATLAQFAHTEEIFTPALMGRLKGEGQSSSLPIFVVGMPRSGTTLVSEILASHRRAFCVGEIGEFGNAIARHQPLKPTPGNDEWITETAAAPTAAFLKDVGHRYLRGLTARAPQSDRIIDKLTLNFRFAGLIHLALPGARIIHVRRNALDTCLSCYFALFLGAHPYSYDLAELGRYYRGYEELMDHWRRTLPAGVMLEINYEDLVEDLEGEARRMIDHCGLDWDPACLRFNEGQRWVRTASAVQVRQPLYATSVGRYRFYDPLLLQPLIGALGYTEDGRRH